MKPNLLVLTALVLLSPWSQAAVADRIRQYDKNGDGRISRDEFPGTAALFDRLDRNRDGFIDNDEAGAVLNAQRKNTKAPRTAASVPADVVAETDITYKSVGGEKLRLDLYRVKGRTYGKAPLLVWIHGGGYVKGSKDGAVKHNAEVMVPLLEQHGYVVASVDYRFCNPGRTNIVDCYTDCKDAVRFLVQNASRYGIDPSRIVTIGSSAGGGLALVAAISGDADLPGDPDLAKVPVRVRATVSWFGVTDFAKSQGEFDRGDEKRDLLFGPHPTQAMSDSVSPVWYLNHGRPRLPVLLVHGESDTVVPFSQSVWMKTEAGRLNWPVEFVAVKNMRHGFQPAGTGALAPSLPEIWQATIAFILKSNGGAE